MPEPNTLYYGDNLEVLRERVQTSSIDLVYLDPPFNSNQTYNILFGRQHEAQAQIQAFDDTWQWTPETERIYFDLIAGGAPHGVADAIQAMYQLLGPSPFLAYLVMMVPRLVELHRTLKPTGSLYLHCDPTASHYLKVLLDALFGPLNFRNEIVWRRSSGHNKLSRQFGPIHDILLFYSRTGDCYLRSGVRPVMRGYVREWFTGEDERGPYRTNMLTGPGTRTGTSGQPWHGFDPTTIGRHWAIPRSVRDLLPPESSGWTTQQTLDFLNAAGVIYIPRDGAGQPKYKQHVGGGIPYQDIWAYQPYTQGTLYGSEEAIDEDVKWVEHGGERLPYPTQKPIGLLSRIIQSSCPEDGIVLDPFCGCGTTVVAAQALGRRWVGIDITYIAIDLVRRRLEDIYSGEAKFTIDGIPRDLAAAAALFQRSPFDFERWAVSLVYGQPNERQVGDRGIDGVIRFPLDRRGASGRALVSVKGGHQVHPSFVRDLLGTVNGEGAVMGVLITLADPTRGMVDAANRAGNYNWPFDGRSYPKIQLVTVQQLLDGHRLRMPPPLMPYLSAQRHAPVIDQLTLGQG